MLGVEDVGLLSVGVEDLVRAGVSTGADVGVEMGVCAAAATGGGGGAVVGCFGTAGTESVEGSMSEGSSEDRRLLQVFDFRFGAADRG